MITKTEGVAFVLCVAVLAFASGWAAHAMWQARQPAPEVAARATPARTTCSDLSGWAWPARADGTCHQADKPPFQAVGVVRVAYPGSPSFEVGLPSAPEGWRCWTATELNRVRVHCLAY